MKSLNQRKYLERLQFVGWVQRENRSSRIEIDGDVHALETKEDFFELAEIVSNCRACSLHQTRKNTVFGEGSPSADWLFVGEAPGAEEDRRGLPFVGRAGQLLHAMVTALGLTRDDIYVANVLKCRPPNNRDPLGEEVSKCEGYLHKQITLLEPRLIVALGRFAAQSLLNSSLPIGKLRGKLHRYDPFGIPLVATYHPAYLLRSPLEKRKVWSDLILAKSVLS